MLLAVALLACGPSARETTIKTTFVALNASRDGFVTYDAMRQGDIVGTAKDETTGKAALVDYREKRAYVLSLFEASYHALAAAVLANDKVTLVNMLNAVGELRKALIALGVRVTP